MTPRRLTRILLVPIAGILLAIAVAAPAAAVTTEQKLTVMSSWSQATSASYNAWAAARANQAAWAAYSFDWSTDYCSSSPDQPLGFDFRMPCARHDFGYRNYKAMGQFPANKSRIDSAFYFDLKAKCATYSVWVRAACYSLAWSYYQAVKALGAVPAAAVDRAAELKAEGLRDQTAVAVGIAAAS
jgi:Prokaryotic phospholipase A2